MEHKIRELIENADIISLNMLKEKISTGKFNIVDDINQRIKKMEFSHGKYCPVCGNDIVSENISNYTIIFGPESFRRKASFCALDCLTYFVSNMKEENKSNKQENSKIYN